MTKGQIEAEISRLVVKFEKEYMGRGPRDTKTVMMNNHILIVVDGFLSHSEQKLAEDGQGVKVIKEMRQALFETSRQYLVTMIEAFLETKILSTHSDVSTKTGEKVIVLTLEKSIL
ncbi:MAG: DUF2294 domain-containing protein [Cellulosilyticaceae bacterium]